jgi:FAD:protein FMN transferase
MKSAFPRIESLEFSGMGTDLGLLIAVKNEEETKRAQMDMATAKEKYIQLEKIFSRFDPESELSFLNSHLDKYTLVSEDMAEVVRKALDHYEKTNGLFDPRVISVLESAGYARDFKKNDFTPVLSEEPPEISGALENDLQISGNTVKFYRRMDFSGIVKGYTTDKIAALFKKKGWRNFMVDSGGDIFAAGRSLEREKWNIAIEGIAEKNLRLTISEKAVATSGISRRKWEREGKRFHHLVHPGHPAEFSFDLRTVSVIADSAEEADIMAKILFIQSEAERIKFAENQNIATIFLYYSGRAWISPAAKLYCIVGP